MILFNNFTPVYTPKKNKCAHVHQKHARIFIAALVSVDSLKLEIPEGCLLSEVDMYNLVYSYNDNYV